MAFTTIGSAILYLSARFKEETNEMYLLVVPLRMISYIVHLNSLLVDTLFAYECYYQHVIAMDVMCPQIVFG